MSDDVNKILDERKKTHGDFTDHARITTSLKFTMQGEPGWSKLAPVQKECLDMIAHKIGRILAGDPNVKDHWNDIAGYSMLVANRCPEPPFAPNAASNFSVTPDNYCVSCDRENVVFDVNGRALCQYPNCTKRKQNNV